MNAILELEQLGYEFWVVGATVHYQHVGERPDPEQARQSLEYLRRHREEVLQVLRDRAELQAPAWVSHRVKLEDLEDFKARWGLRVADSEWPKGTACLIVRFESASDDIPRKVEVDWGE